MSAWIVAIDEEHPDHLDFALEDGFWDTRNSRQILPGYEVFFWVSGAGLRAWADATEGLRELRNLDRRARWHDRDTTQYRYRFGVRPRQRVDVKQRWKQISRDTGIRQPLSNGILEVPLDAVPVMRAYFGDVETVTRRTDSAYLSTTYEIGMDMRARAMQEVVVRRGQSEFRDQLLGAYQRCAVTGSEVAAVLEAAHIDRYFGDHSHHVTNGLLLRSDIHTLFDAELLTVDDNYTVLIAPRIAESEYAAFAGQRLHVPADPLLQPERTALERHRGACRWLTSAAQ